MFEVGKKVICIKQYPYNIEIKKGDIVQLLGIRDGCKNFPLLIDVGAAIPIGYSQSGCPKCGAYFSNITAWLCSTHFAPYDDSLSEITAEELIEELENELITV